MPTMRETVIGLAGAGNGALTVRRLFVEFCFFARKKYIYSATKVRGAEGHTLPGRSDAEIVTVDCAGLADALVILLNENFAGEARRVEVIEMDGFATAPHSQCFDPNVVGNVRKPGGTYAETGRCVFMSHYFVETAGDIRLFLDPCLFTGYAKKADAVAWALESGGVRREEIIKFVVGDKNVVLVRVPNEVPAPIGFAGGFIIFKRSDFSPEELGATLGRIAARQKFGWSDEAFKLHETAALDRINKLLREKAGVPQQWVL